MKKNILVVDDSALMRRYICDIINTDDLFQATDVCKDGQEAYEQLKKQSYDLVLLDVTMPRLDGLRLLEKLQKEKIKATVVMVSSLTQKDAQTTMLAMERGAVDFVAKPMNMMGSTGADFRTELLSIMRAVLRLAPLEPESGQEKPEPGVLSTSVRTPLKKWARGTKVRKLVAMACSTGGPRSLQSVIPHLPKNLDAPVVLVQHMPPGFTKSLADRLNETSEVSVKEAEDGEVLQNGWVYVAPGAYHMEIVRSGDGGHKIALNQKPPVGGLRPYANIMYESLRSSTYDEITCVVLTGMGADGSEGIISLGQKKPVYVICQDEASSVVYGMPRSVIQAGAADEVVTLTEVAQSITKSVGVK